MKQADQFRQRACAVFFNITALAILILGPWHDVGQMSEPGAGLWPLMIGSLLWSASLLVWTRSQHKQ